MMSTFNLKSDVPISEFQTVMFRLYDHLQSKELVDSYGSIFARSSDTPMDTDTDRPHAFSFITIFVSQNQCDAAYTYIGRQGSEVAAIHAEMMAMVLPGAVFSCWEELN